MSHIYEAKITALEGECERLREANSRLRGLLPSLTHALDKAYLYQPMGHKDDWWALSWNGRTRIAEKMVKPWADDLLAVFQFYLEARKVLTTPNEYEKGLS